MTNITADAGRWRVTKARPVTFGAGRVTELRKLLCAIDAQCAEAVEQSRREAHQRAQQGRKRTEAAKHRQTIANAHAALNAPEPPCKYSHEWSTWSLARTRAPSEISSAEQALAFLIECYPSLAVDDAERRWADEKRRPAREYWEKVYAERGAANKH